MKIAVASGKGGTGKTLVATNLFYSVQQSDIQSTLVDCDAEEPNVGEFITGDASYCNDVSQNIPVIDSKACVFCGKCFEYCNYNAIIYLPESKFIQVLEELCHDCGACSVACKYNAITEKEKKLGEIKFVKVPPKSNIIEARVDVGVYSSVPVIKKAIKEVDAEYLTILDAPPGISCPFIATVNSADFVILVTEPTPFGLNDLKLSVETLQFLQKPYGVIVNRAGLGNRDVFDWIEKNHILLLMEIPFDREIARIYSEGGILSQKIPAYQTKFFGLLKTIEKYLAR